MNTESSTMSIFDIIQALREGQRLFFSILAICAILTLVVIFTSTRYYQGNVVVKFSKPLTQNAQSLTGGLSAGSILGGLTGKSSGELEEVKVIIFSYRFFQKFAESEKLLQYIYVDLWDSESNQWMVSKEDQPNYQEAYEIYLTEMISVEEISNEILKISVSSPAKNMVAKWSNGIISLLDMELRAKDVKIHASNIEFLTEKLQNERNSYLVEVASSLLKNELSSLMLAQNSAGYTTQILDPAVTPIKPSRPSRLFIALGGALFGFLLSFSAVMVRYTYFTK